MLLKYVGAALAGTAIVWVASDVFESASERLAAYYELPAIVQGAVIAAVGSSFPELSSTVLSSALHGAFEIGVAGIVGSAIFNILVIPAVASLRTKGLSSDRDLVFKEAGFYVISIACLFVVFSLAVIYNPVGNFGGEVTRLLAIIPVLFYIFYIFLQYHDTVEFEGVTADVTVSRQWSLLVAGLIGITVGVEGLVWATIGFGDYFGTSGFVWALIVIAAGTSIPDLFVTVRAADAGRDGVGMANVLGSNIFDLLIAIPTGVLIAGSGVVQFARAAPLLSVLVVCSMVLLAFLRIDMRLSRRESYMLLSTYCLYLIWAVFETTGLVSFLPA